MSDTRRLNKKILIAGILAVAVLFGSLSGFRIYTYLEDHDTKQNAISVGEASVTIDEDYAMPESLTASTVYDKLVKIRNNGSCDCFIRVSVKASDENVDPNGYGIDTDEWTDGGDGYYYYNGIVNTGDSVQFMDSFKTAGVIKTDNGDTEDESDDTYSYTIQRYIGDTSYGKKEVHTGTEIYIYTEAWEAEKTEDELKTSDISSEKILELVKNKKIFQS